MTRRLTGCLTALLASASAGCQPARSPERPESEASTSREPAPEDLASLVYSNTSIVSARRPTALDVARAKRQRILQDVRAEPQRQPRRRRRAHSSTTASWQQHVSWGLAVPITDHAGVTAHGTDLAPQALLEDRQAVLQFARAARRGAQPWLELLTRAATATRPRLAERLLMGLEAAGAPAPGVAERAQGPLTALLDHENATVQTAAAGVAHRVMLAAPDLESGETVVARAVAALRSDPVDVGMRLTSNPCTRETKLDRPIGARSWHVYTSACLRRPEIVEPLLAGLVREFRTTSDQRLPISRQETRCLLLLCIDELLADLTPTQVRRVDEALSTSGAIRSWTPWTADVESLLVGDVTFGLYPHLPDDRLVEFEAVLQMGTYRALVTRLSRAGRGTRFR